jgi:hypothetical protein
MKIESTGRVAIGNPIFFDGALHVSTTTNQCSFVTRTHHDFDLGDAQKSVVYRPLTIGYRVSYNDNTSTYYVYGNGQIYSNGVQITSDVSLKRNIKTILNPLDKVMQLRGVTFDMDFPANTATLTTNEKEPSFEQQYERAKVDNPELTFETFKQIESEQSRQQMGVIAQEVEKIVPEVVRTRIDGLKAVSYSELTGLLIEAIKEQQHEIEALKVEVAAVKGMPSSAELRSSTGISELTQQWVLTQNAPNPFTQQTVIKYFVPNDAKAAYICIFDMHGKMIQKISVAPGQNSTTIQGSTLKAGMYLYSLLIDGQEVDTKRMILTK